MKKKINKIETGSAEMKSAYIFQYYKSEYNLVKLHDVNQSYLL